MISSSSLAKILTDRAGLTANALDRTVVELRQAGILESKGRGRSAAQVTLEHARDLIFAMLGANSPKEAPDAVRRLNGLTDAEGIKLGDAFTEIMSKKWLRDCVIYLEVARMADYAVLACSADGGQTQEMHEFTGATPVRGFDVRGTISGGILRAVFALLEAPIVTPEELEKIGLDAKRQLMEWEKADIRALFTNIQEFLESYQASGSGEIVTLDELACLFRTFPHRLKILTTHTGPTRLPHFQIGSDLKFSVLEVAEWAKNQLADNE